MNMISGTSGISGATDSNFVLQLDKRTENTAKLICTGRDIEQLEIFLEFSKSDFIWKPLKPIEVETRAVENYILSLCEFIKSEVEFIGNATELLEQLSAKYPVECVSTVLAKKVNKNKSFLTSHGITCTTSRTGKARTIHLIYNPLADESKDLVPVTK